VKIFGWYGILRQVIVNTKTDKAFRGVIWKKTKDCIVLKNAEWLSVDGAKKIDGELIIFISEIDFIQAV
jgi:hypothetical protein